MEPLRISGLNIFPVKSLAGIALNSAVVQPRGFQYDRRWALVNENNVFIHQRDYTQMALLQPSIEDNKLVITHKNNPELNISAPLTPESDQRESVTVWADTCDAVEVSRKVSQWFTDFFGFECRLMYMPDDSIRPTDPDYSVDQENKVSFADGYPINIVSEASMELLNARIAGPDLPIGRFRANIILSGGHPHIEDELGQFEINGITLHGVKPCARCVMTTVDLETAEKGKEPLRTLSTYRKSERGILFAQNCIPATEGEIRLGDTVLVKERLKPLTF